jgi:hypothetical protein
VSSIEQAIRTPSTHPRIELDCGFGLKVADESLHTVCEVDTTDGAGHQSAMYKKSAPALGVRFGKNVYGNPVVPPGIPVAMMCDELRQFAGIQKTTDITYQILRSRTDHSSDGLIQ